MIGNLPAAPAALLEAPVEMVPTSALREGDLIRDHGCIMRIGVVNESMAHKPDENGVTYWSRAEVLHRYTDTIPMSWFTNAEGKKVWTVQGNDLAKWARIIGGEKA